MPYEIAGIQSHVIYVACQDTDKLPALFGGCRDQISQARGCSTVWSEMWGEDPLWEHILDGIWTVCPDLTSPDTHRLVLGAIFIRRLSKADWRKLQGVTQQIPGGFQSPGGDLIPRMGLLLLTELPKGWRSAAFRSDSARGLTLSE